MIVFNLRLGKYRLAAAGLYSCRRTRVLMFWLGSRQVATIYFGPKATA